MKPEELLSKWLQRVGRIQTGHYEAAAALERRHYWLGVPTITLSALVGSSMFSTLGQNSDPQAKWAIAVASVLTAILASMQTVLRYGERAARHKTAGVRYGIVKREVEQFLTFVPVEEAAIKVFAEQIRIHLDKLNEESPSIPQGIWDRLYRRAPNQAMQQTGGA